jgi:SMODS-associating 2TM, beta-strand rich effector domain
MRNLNLKPFLFILLFFSGIVWFIVATASGFDMKNLIDFMRPIPLVVTADVILLGFFVKRLWRWKFFQGWLVPFPDLNGTWEGQIQTSWKDAEERTPGPIPVILTIKQTFMNISCVMRTAEMTSHSYVEGFWLEEEKQIRQLCYSYTSKPKTGLRDRSTPHDGTILFNIIGQPVAKLEGEYWTQQQTTGTVTLTFKTKELLDELPSDFPAHPMASV